MLYAAREGLSGAILCMLICGGNPARQGSEWAEFLMAATTTFRPHMAATIHNLMNISQLVPVSQRLNSMHQALPASWPSIAGMQCYDTFPPYSALHGESLACEARIKVL